jgi:hypothetical protein
MHEAIAARGYMVVMGQFAIGDLQDIVRTVKARGASLKATEQPIDTSTAAGKVLSRHAWRVRRVRNEPAP